MTNINLSNTNFNNTTNSDINLNSKIKGWYVLFVKVSGRENSAMKAISRLVKEKGYEDKIERFEKRENSPAYVYVKMTGDPAVRHDVEKRTQGYFLPKKGYAEKMSEKEVRDQGLDSSSDAGYGICKAA